MKNLIIGVILGAFIAGSTAFFITHFGCEKDKDLVLEVKTAALSPTSLLTPAEVADVPRHLKDFNSLYDVNIKGLDTTIVVLHSIESIKLFVKEFDSIIKEPTILGTPPSGFSWQVGFYPFINSAKKISFYIIPTLAERTSAVPTSTVDKEIFRNIQDYISCNSNRTYYPGGNKTPIYDFGSLYP